MASVQKNLEGLTPKQATYVAARLEGLDRVAAYRRAYSPIATVKTAREKACRLEARPAIKLAMTTATQKRAAFDAKIEAKVAEKASDAIVEKVIATRTYVLGELLDNAAKAKAKGNWNGSNRALELIGKELGMFKEAQAEDLFAELSPEHVRELKSIIDRWIGNGIPDEVA